MNDNLTHWIERKIMDQIILQKAKELEPWIIETRRHFHTHPEASMEEYWTTAEICKYLDELGIPYQKFEGSTGCIATIKGAHPGKTVALRSDIDGLSVTEENETTYKSVNDGFMHACGHDAHIAMNLAAARILNDLKDELHGNIIHIFQPGEEFAQGAKAIMAQGDWFDAVDNIFGCHIWNNLEAGKISLEAGPRMASADAFFIDIQGSAGHGAHPEQCVDATVVAAATVMNLQTLVSREVSPLDSLVVTVGKINSGTRFNVISGAAHLEGTVRYFTKELTNNIDAMIERIVSNTAAMYRAEAKLVYEHLAKPLVNDEASSQIAAKAVTKLFGAEAIELMEKSTGAEDFGEYLAHKPGVYVFLGSRNPAVGADAPHHHGCFNVDESVLKQGAALYAQYAVEFLNERES